MGRRGEWGQVISRSAFVRAVGVAARGVARVGVATVAVGVVTGTLVWLAALSAPAAHAASRPGACPRALDPSAAPNTEWAKLPVGVYGAFYVHEPATDDESARGERVDPHRHRWVVGWAQSVKDGELVITTRRSEIQGFGGARRRIADERVSVAQEDIVLPASIPSPTVLGVLAADSNHNAVLDPWWWLARARAEDRLEANELTGMAIRVTVRDNTRGWGGSRSTRVIEGRFLGFTLVDSQGDGRVEDQALVVELPRDQLRPGEDAAQVIPPGDVVRESTFLVPAAQSDPSQIR